jgi:cytochrome c biogenesis protein CcdA
VAFAIASATLVLTLAGASIVLANVSDRRLTDLRSQGPYMKRIGGSVLVAVGVWFGYLAITNPTYLLA